MRNVLWFGLAIFAFGCADPGSVPGGAAGAAGAADIGVTEQAAQFADDTIFNLVDLTSATIMFTADFNPTTVNLFYVNAKTTDSGNSVGSVDLVQTISLAADQTKGHVVNFNHPALAGGYGALVVDSAGGGPFDVFQTHLISANNAWSVGGSVFTGGSYRMPYVKGINKVVLAITNQSDFAFDVEISNLGTTNFKVINIPPLYTYKFDSSLYGWTFPANNPGSVQLFTTAGGVIALSGYYQKGSTKTRFYPVKAAPYW